MIFLANLENRPRFVSAWDNVLDLRTPVNHVRRVNVDAADSSDKDAQPHSRVPPYYPEKCMRKAAHHENIHVKFDVSKKGIVENIETLSSTNDCLTNVALTSVKQWVYLPKFVDGGFQRRTGVETVITFVLQQ